MANPQDDPFATLPEDPGKYGREDPFLDPPPIDDPDAGALPLPSDTPNVELDGLGLEVDALKAADTPPLGAPPEIKPPDLGQPPKPFGDEIKEIVNSDKSPLPTEPEPGYVRPPPPETPSPSAPRAPQPPPTDPREARRGVVPKTFLEFKEAVAGQKRADGQPYHPSAVANMYRRYKEMGEDGGMNMPAGQEHLEFEQGQSDRAFYTADKGRFQAQASLDKLLTQVAVEGMRETTQLRDYLIRNRH